MHNLGNAVLKKMESLLSDEGKVLITWLTVLIWLARPLINELTAARNVRHNPFFQDKMDLGWSYVICLTLAEEIKRVNSDLLLRSSCTDGGENLPLPFLETASICQTF